MKCIFLNIPNVKAPRQQKWSDQIDEQIKTKRSNELLALEKKMSKEFRDAHIGKEDEALLEEPVAD